MSALTRSPTNTTLLQPTKYLVSIDRIPTVKYFCQTANIPGVNIGTAEYSTPFLDIHTPGTKITYSPFDMKFLVDEDLKGWREIHDWFRAIATPVSFEERNTITQMNTRKQGKSLLNYSDITLTVLNALNNPVVRVQFINAFPTSLSDIEFDTGASADDILTATTSFTYEYFNILDI
jgi:hypothetical protein